MSDSEQVCCGSAFSVFCGLDVGKGEPPCHRAGPGGTATARPGRCPTTKLPCAGCSASSRAHGRVLVVVDQPASIGALPIAVARDLGIEVAYLPGLAMRRIADLHPGQTKTDARDAYVIADAARTMPHTLRQIRGEDETQAGLGVLAGYDADLAAQSTRLTNRLRDALLTRSPRAGTPAGKAHPQWGRTRPAHHRPHPGRPTHTRHRRHHHRHGRPFTATGQDAARPNPHRAGRPDRDRPRHHRVRQGDHRRRQPAARHPRRTCHPRRRPRRPACRPTLLDRS